MPRRLNRTVWLAKVSFVDRRPGQLAFAHERFEEALRRALNPSVAVSYYGREWRLSEPRLLNQDRVLAAELGFRRKKRREEVDYDESKHEWVSTEAPASQGNFVHFVVDLDSQFIGFEDRGEDLSRNSFIAALSRFLMYGGLEIQLVSDVRQFEAWLAEVDRVTRFRATLRRPNPGYSRRARQVRELAGETEAERLTIEATSDEGLNVQGTILEGAADTAATGNGEFKASGFSGHARKFFDSTKRYLSGIIEVGEQDSSGVISAKLRELLHELAPRRDDEDRE
jgi:hypothetical protein